MLPAARSSKPAHAVVALMTPYEEIDDDQGASDLHGELQDDIEHSVLRLLHERHARSRASGSRPDFAANRAGISIARFLVVARSAIDRGGQECPLEYGSP